MTCHFDLYTPDEIREIVTLSRLNLYNHNKPCGAKAIMKQLESSDIRPLPSLSLIGKILHEEGLTYRRTGNY
jgi:hypothetical protein